MAVERIDPELCNGCGICINSCMMDVIRFDEIHNKAIIKYLEDCQTCFNCEQDCPTGAIFVSAVEKAPLSWG